MEDQIRMIIADDHPIFREGLVRTVQRQRDFAVVGQAADGGEALRLISELHPDVAVLDLSMPVFDGLEVARRVHQSALPTELVILTMYKDTVYFDTAMDRGVRGYVLKDGAAGEILVCLDAVLGGKCYVSPTIVGLLAERPGSEGRQANAQPLRQRLSPAEMSILKLVSENRTSKEIAERLYVSVRTVENHRMHMCQKLGLKGPHALLQFALEHRTAL
jgi:DNA-binding NarL/FixJ family response regulator